MIIENPSDLILELLGLSPKHPQFKQLEVLIGKPGEITESKSFRAFDFEQYGVTLLYSKDHSCFIGAGFAVDTAGVKAGDTQPYPWTLPKGIRAADTRSDVSRKIGVNPYFTSKPQEQTTSAGCDYDQCRPHGYWEKYELQPFHYTCIFNSEQDGLSLLGVDLCKFRLFGEHARPRKQM